MAGQSAQPATNERIMRLLEEVRSQLAESKERENLRVVNWARLVREHPYWLAGDGVHVSAEGYQVRARAVARSVRRCR